MTTSASTSWLRCHKVDGHGVASGVANRDPSRPPSPYPEGSIAMQMPHFAARGLDLTWFWPGTINLSFAPCSIRLSNPDVSFADLRWTDHHPPETFSFWSVQLRDPLRQWIHPALIYYPHPETKVRHHQSNAVLEVLAPWIGDLQPQASLQIGVDPNRIVLHPSSP